MQLGAENYNAACSLPMSKITSLYIEHFEAINQAKYSKRPFEMENKFETVKTVITD